MGGLGRCFLTPSAPPPATTCCPYLKAQVPGWGTVLHTCRTTLKFERPWRRKVAAQVLTAGSCLVQIVCRWEQAVGSGQGLHRLSKRMPGRVCITRVSE